MVKRYYVVTAGIQVGVFYDHWINIAPLVKNKRDSVWQGASSREEAEEMFEQARLKGYVRVVNNTSPISSLSPDSMRRSSGNSTPTTGNSQPSDRTAASRITGSQLQGHVSADTSHYVPGHFNARDTSRASGSTSILSRSLSEPSQAYNPTRECVPNAAGGRVEKSNRNETSQIRATVDSPSWLASYPDEEDEAFLTPPLSPIISPVISSRLFGPSKSEPASTYSIPLSSADGAPERSASDGGGSHTGFRSPKPIKQSASFSFSSRPQKGGVDIGASDIRRNTDQSQSGRDWTMTASSEDLGVANSSQLRMQEVIDPIIELVTKVDRLARELRIHLDSPSTQSNASPLHGKKQGHARESKRLANALAGVGSAGSPRSSHRISRAPAHLNSTASPGSARLRSLLFAHDRGLSSPASQSSPCKHCNGTGYDAEEISILERAGLMQPSLTPYHSHSSSQDPRSPFTGSRTFNAPVSPTSFGRPSPAVKSETIGSTRPSPLLISATKTT